MYLIAALQLLAQQVFSFRDEHLIYLLFRCPIFEIGWCLDIAEPFEVEVKYLFSPANILYGFEYTQSVSSACQFSFGQFVCILRAVMLSLEMMQPNVNILMKLCVET
jgi:hypothetical protein